MKTLFRSAALVAALVLSFFAVRGAQAASVPAQCKNIPCNLCCFIPGPQGSAGYCFPRVCPE